MWVEAGTDHDVCIVETIEETAEIRWVMLAIRIHLNYCLEPLALRVEKGRTHGSTHPNIEGKAHHTSAGFQGLIGGPIRGSIVHNKDLDAQALFAHKIDHHGY